MKKLNERENALQLLTALGKFDSNLPKSEEDLEMYRFLEVTTHFLKEKYEIYPDDPDVEDSENLDLIKAIWWDEDLS